MRLTAKILINREAREEREERKNMLDQSEFSELSKRVIGCAIEVHKALGPGLLESAYRLCLCHELAINGIKFEMEQPLPVIYKGCKLD